MTELMSLEEKVLNLPPCDREKLALAALESLRHPPETTSDLIELGLKRDREIESGAAKLLNESEFFELLDSKTCS